MTDFGQRDGYVGVMKGVVLGITPHAQLVDITHEIEPQKVAAGAWILATSYRYFPRGTTFVCVVDPGVGSVRYPIAMYAGEWFFVGPDNGLFSYVFTEQPLHEVVILSKPAYRLEQMSTTFHGRDIFAPGAAHIARGLPLAALGPSIDPLQLQRLDLKFPMRQGERIDGYIVYIDYYGNLITNIPLSMVPALFSSPEVQLTVCGSVITERRRFFAEGEEGSPFIYSDSSGYVSVAVHSGNAARTLHVGSGEPVRLVVKS
jgi:hypothetical protein